MDTASPRRLKRSDRARQMREAQRRRRERLRQDNRRFLQIILPEDLRLRLYDMSEKSQQTLQDCVLSLIQRSLGEAMSDDVSSNDISAEPLKTRDDMIGNPGNNFDDVSPDTAEVSRPAIPEVESVEAAGPTEQTSQTGPTQEVAEPEVAVAPSAEASGADEAPKGETATEVEPEPAGKRKKAKRPTNQMELF